MLEKQAKAMDGIYQITITSLGITIGLICDLDEGGLITSLPIYL